MSGIINKVKEALSGESHTTTGHTAGTTGTTGNAYTTGTTGTTGNNYATGTTGTTGGFNESTNAGPHNSNLANKIDPRVDSDLDGRGNHYTTTTGGGAAGAGNTYTTGTTGTSGAVGGSTGAGPHSSSLLNKLDPRVDSTTGAVNTGTTHTGNTYSSGTTGTTRTTGTTGTTGGYNNSTNAGPHSSSLANKLDPTVNSNVDGRGAGHTGNTYTTGTTGTTGGLSSSTNAGPHDSNLANKLDPRVDSDLDGRGNRHGANTGGVFGASGSHATPGRGTAQNTAGPHNSDLVNKLDPRVDSDMDGSATAGVNRTYAATENKDPLNAAHVPPSVLRESLGAPIITHDNPHHDHQGRHGSMSHQEAHLHRGSEAI